MKVEDMSNAELNDEFNRLVDIYETDRENEIDDRRFDAVKRELSNRIMLGTFAPPRMAP